MAQEQGQYFDNIPTLNVEGAKAILKNGIATAELIEVSGFLVVYSRTGMQEVSQATGPLARPAHVEIAQAKAASVLNMRKSNRKLAEWLLGYRPGFRPEDFAGQIRSLLPGGVAIFDSEDARTRKFIGAVAFSGGEPEEDEHICVNGIFLSRLYSDITKAESLKLYEDFKNLQGN
ncbi:MAG: heme-binding protein [Candidatus Daviesbacteria bacterium]|nr:heme-binding protein [Candidatus Daviesbacteria bacterium]